MGESRRIQARTGADRKYNRPPAPRGPPPSYTGAHSPTATFLQSRPGTEQTLDCILDHPVGPRGMPLGNILPESEGPYGAGDGRRYAGRGRRWWLSTGCRGIRAHVVMCRISAVIPTRRCTRPCWRAARWRGRGCRPSPRRAASARRQRRSRSSRGRARRTRRRRSPRWCSSPCR